MTIALGALIGYLLGSISVARIIANKVVPDETSWTTSYPVGSEGFVTETNALSPSAVGMRAGARYGGLATLGDMAKAALAVGIVWWLLGRDAAAAAGAAAVVGHCWPVFHRFRGAYGQSPIIGAALVLSPLSIPFAIVAGTAASWLVLDVLFMTLLWPLFLIVWGATFSDGPFLWFAIVANAVYLVRVWPQVLQRIAFRREQRPDARRRARELLGAYRSNPFSPDAD